MSAAIKQKLENQKKPLGVSRGCNLNSIELFSEQPSKIHLENGSVLYTECLHCPDQPCTKYSESENQDAFLNSIRSDVSMQTCAVDAIHWDYDSSSPIIDSERCILCGICASRCPSQAIYLTKEGAKVSVANGNESIFSEDYKIDVKSHVETRKLLSSILIKGNRLCESVDVVSNMLTRVKKLKGKVAGLYPNLLVRNLLRSLNFNAVGYAQGVQFNTVDVLCAEGDIYGVVEVELSSAIIDTPRNLAADIAVLVARYSLDFKKLNPLSIGLQLPNGREQYWMVVDDMNNILDLKIRTITILALFILLWSRVNFSLNEIGLFLSEKEGASLRAFLENKIGRTIAIPQGFENQLEPAKLVQSQIE